MKKTFKMCARLIPYTRPCQDCKHAKSCALYYNDEPGQDDFADMVRDYETETVNQ